LLANSRVLQRAMQLGFYELQLLALASVCAISLALERHVAKKNHKIEKASVDDRLEDGIAASTSGLSSLMRKYLLVYAIVMGADWLQGPYVYSLYREQYGYPERTVALFFVTGFLSAGLAAPMVGAWADQHGRRKLCLVFCITYTLSCVCVAIPSTPILFIGRLLGGFSTSILFSAFESWLISAAGAASLPSADLSTIMGRATLINGIVATVAGVTSNHLVGITHNFLSPFVASGLLLMVAWYTIRSLWSENYGSKNTVDQDVFQFGRLGKAWHIVRRDPLLLVLGLTQTCFEGSMYLFVFLWVPSLQEHASRPSLPLGYIFSSFMISMMLGSLLYTTIISYHQSISNKPCSDSSLVLHGKISSLVCAVSALSLATSISSPDERYRFWAFCVFEACVGLYYPVQGTLRGTLVSNEHRATVASLFRVPLNVFVVVSLLTGVSEARIKVLTAASVMLSFSAIMTGSIIVPYSHERAARS